MQRIGHAARHVALSQWLGQHVDYAEVVRPIETRVGASVAATCYVDDSQPPVIREIAPGIMVIRGEGRPSKRLRRELERMRRAGEIG
jgi:ribosome-associated heat shock protein Hsp15